MEVLLLIFADISPAALAPTQHDINIAVLAVILGSILVGYEKVVRGRQGARAKSTTESSRDIINS